MTARRNPCLGVTDIGPYMRPVLQSKETKSAVEINLEVQPDIGRSYFTL